MTLTLKGRIIVALLILLLLGGGGMYLYSWFTGQSPGQLWQELTTYPAGEPVKSPGPSDGEIKAQLYEMLFSQADLRKQNISFTVANGVVSFSGEVDAPQHKAALDQVGQRIAGIKQVFNHVTVKTLPPQPASGQDPDQQLAKQVEFALYETDAFDLKLMTITASDGHVRLAGSVRNLAEKLLAKRIAKEVPGVTEVVDELTLQPVQSPAAP